MPDGKLSNKKLAFYVALVYVILATIYSFWAMRNLVSDGILFYLFFPATIFPSLILFTEREPGFMVLICQAITLLLIWPLFWLFIHLFRNNNKLKDIADN
jgi:4-hydroxybenzoate polyprenyltransferase